MKCKIFFKNEIVGKILKTLNLIVTGVLLFFTFLSCSDSESENSTEIKATEVKDVDTAVKALQDAIDEGKIIEGVFHLPENKGWEIFFTDATGIKFEYDTKQVKTPYITIGSDSCWFVSNDNTESFDRMVDADRKSISSKNGENSVTDVLNTYVLAKQQSHNPLIDAIAEDNNSQVVIIAMSDGKSYSFRRTDNILKSFSILSAKNPDLVFDDIVYCIGSNNLVAYTPYVFDQSSLVASFTTSPDTKVFVGENEQASGVTANNFTEGVNYRLLSSDKCQNSYNVRIRHTGIPVVYIQTPGAAPIVSKEEWIKDASIKIVYPDGTVDYESNVLQIRGRGNFTWDNFPKKPYALKLDKRSKILGMPKHKRWVLLANWQDRTLMRNDISFEIAKQTELSWTPRGYFVEVVLNDKHQGNYYLCEQVKVDENRVDVAEMTAEDIAGGAVTGGYLIEMDEYFDEVNKFMSTMEFPYMFKDPDEDILQKEQFEYFQNFIAAFEKSLLDEKKYKNHEYMTFIDIDSFIDFWFAQELCGNWEANYPKSCYFNKNRNGKLKAGPVWDFDWSTFIPEESEQFRIKDAVYYPRLFGDPKFVERVKERWTLLKPKFDTVTNTIRERAAQIKESEKFNIALWPITTNHNGDEKLTFQEAIDYMVKAYDTKLKWMDSQIPNL